MPDTQINIQSEETAIEFIQEQVAIDFVQEQVAIEFVQETAQIDFVSESIVLNLTGVPGPVGPPGADGSDGADGVGVPAGGSAGQVLAKIDGDDFNTEWVDLEDGGGPGGASITDITYADMQTALTDGTLTEGAFYRITDAAGTDLGFVCQAVKTNEITVNGTGGYLNADFQAAGDYSGVEAVTGVTPGTQLGIWRTGFEVITIPYTNLSGGTFAVGDTITGGTTGATAVIVTDDGASSMTAYMTSAGVALDGSEVLDNGNGVTSDQDGAAGSPTIILGDVVIWNLLHYMLTNDTLLDGTDPATNTAAYTQLLKTDAGQGYITAWDISEFDFAGNLIEYRQDLRGGLVRGNVGVSGYQFGRDDCGGNNIQSPATFDIRNLIAAFNNNTTYPGANVSDLTTGAGTTAENNILENGASLTGITAGANCSISNNSIGSGSSISNVAFLNDSTIQNSVLTGGGFINNITANDNDIGLSGNVLTGGRIADIILTASGARIENNIITRGRIAELTFGGNVSLSQNTLAPDAVIESLTLGADTVLENNIIENGGSLKGIESGANCSISRNKIGQGATMGGDTTMGDGARFEENEIGPNATIGNISADGYATVTGNYVGANGSLYGLTLGAFSYVSGLRMSVGAELSGIILESDGVSVAASISNCEIASGCVIGNKTLAQGVVFKDSVIGVTMDETETIADNIEGKRSIPGFSDIPGTIDIDGITTLDCTAAWAQYRGIINVTSPNATENIDTITNPPTLFPFTIRPAAGLELTITGTAYSGIAAGQIALKAASYDLDGDKGEYIVLEIDPRGTGCLIEKYVGNGLI